MIGRRAFLTGAGAAAVAAVVPDIAPATINYTPYVGDFIGLQRLEGQRTASVWVYDDAMKAWSLLENIPVRASKLYEGLFEFDFEGAGHRVEWFHDGVFHG